MCQWKWLAVIWTTNPGSQIDPHPLNRKKWASGDRYKELNSRINAGKNTHWESNEDELQKNSRTWKGRWKQWTGSRTQQMNETSFFWHRDPRVTSFSYHLPPAHCILKLARVPLAPGIKVAALPSSLLETRWELCPLISPLFTAHIILFSFYCAIVPSCDYTLISAFINCSNVAFFSSRHYKSSVMINGNIIPAIKGEQEETPVVEEVFRCFS